MIWNLISKAVILVLVVGLYGFCFITQHDRNVWTLIGLILLVVPAYHGLDLLLRRGQWVNR